MNHRMSDSENSDFSGQREHGCIHEADWGQWLEFKRNTIEYRNALCKKLSSIQSAIWGLALVVLIPFILGMISIGEIKHTVQQSVEDIRELKREVKELQRYGKG